MRHPRHARSEAATVQTEGRSVLLASALASLALLLLLGVASALVALIHLT